MIFYFSGNGNSQLVANRLSVALAERRVVRLCENVAESHVVTGEKRIIWVFPIYSWGLPKIVQRFIKSVNLIGGNELCHHMVCTCGDDVGLAHMMWRNDIRGRGWTAVSTFSVIMPNTYVALPGFDVDSPDVVKTKLGDAPTRISVIAEMISNNIFIDDVVQGSYAWIKTKVVYPIFMALLTTSKYYRANAKCVQCGICVKICPMHNISIINDKVHWGDQCEMCMACYHVCPMHAVAYGSRTKSKGQYKLQCKE